MAQTRYRKGKAAAELARARQRAESMSNVQLVNAMAGVSMLPGSFDKRFTRDITAMVKDEKPLSVKQQEHLVRCVVKYRRQIDFSRFVNNGKL